jgi:pyruvate dehydrogenase E2 component (dihydrolipoamide acetyltransferase)
MALEITVPEVSEGIEAGTVVTISVAVGDQVEADQTLLELETDKAVVAIPSPQAGKISEIKVNEGDQVEVGAVIMVMDGEGEAGGGAEETGPEHEAGPGEDAAPAKERGPAESGAGPEEKTGADEDAGRQEPEESAESAEPEEQAESEDRAEPEAQAGGDEEVEPEEAAGPDQADRSEQSSRRQQPDLQTIRRGDMVAPAAPSVRRLARDLGVDIYQVQGTGPGGRISETDVRLFVRDTMQRITGGGPAPTAVGEFPGLHAQRPLPDFTRWGEVSHEPLSRVRELTADAMGYAWSTIPMVTQYDKARITQIEEYRKEFNRQATDEAKLTMTSILVKICAAALKEFPRFNSSLDLASKELILKQSVHVGVAVDTPGGLLVPVLREADRKGVERLATELNEIAEKTRNRKISPADMEGGTFTISNLGGIGGHAFTPLVYAPQVAILGVSRAEMQPIWNGRDFVPELVLPLALTYDHRVIDGADGARFLRWICKTIENPLQLVMKG